MQVALSLAPTKHLFTERSIVVGYAWVIVVIHVGRRSASFSFVFLLAGQSVSRHALSCRVSATLVGTYLLLLTRLPACCRGEKAIHVLVLGVCCVIVVVVLVVVVLEQARVGSRSADQSAVSFEYVWRKRGWRWS